MTISRVFIAGAGLMGKGIALDLALRDCPVGLTDTDVETLSGAPRELGRILEYLRGLDFPIPSSFDPLNHIEVSDEIAGAASADLVIETVTEDIDIKLTLYKELEPYLKPGAVLATNTSSLSVSDLAASLAQPGSFIGAHFFNPPYLLPLVEISAGPETSAACQNLVFDFFKTLGKAPVRVRKEVRGLVANRLQFALLWEAISLVQEGVASPEDIDEVVSSSFGRRLAALGPFANADLGGLHTYLKIFQYLQPSMPWEDIPAVLEEAVSQGCLGAATGRGFLSWGRSETSHAAERRDRTLIGLLGPEPLGGSRE